MSLLLVVVFFCKQKTAYEMRISDWSSDVCSSDLRHGPVLVRDGGPCGHRPSGLDHRILYRHQLPSGPLHRQGVGDGTWHQCDPGSGDQPGIHGAAHLCHRGGGRCRLSARGRDRRSEEPTSELQSLMRISYAVFCLKNKTYTTDCTKTDFGHHTDSAN